MENSINKYIDFLKNDLDKDIAKVLFERFKELILSGELPPNSILPNENILSNMLGIGRSTLREAYTALAVLGFIKRSKAGTYVSSIDNIVNIAPFSLTVENSEINDLLEFRVMLECEAASYAAKRANENDIEKIEICYRNMIDNKDNIDLFIDYDTEFHVLLCNASHNSLIINTMRASRHSFEKVVRGALRKSMTKNPRAIDVTIELHGKILSALKEKNYRDAASAMKEHISYINITVKYEM